MAIGGGNVFLVLVCFLLGLTRATRPSIEITNTTLSSIPSFPLITDSRWIVGQDGKRVKLACVNWSGAEEKDWVVGGLDKQPVDVLARNIKSYGFNCVRLLWSVEMWASNPVVPASRLSQNTQLSGLSSLEIFDVVVNQLAAAQLMVVLDNHMSDADWCCSEDDGNGLWYTASYDEKAWIDAWLGMTARYGSNQWVIGAELRNELRGTTINNKRLVPTWGDGNPATDWHAAATRAGNAILGVNPDWLIVVDGLSYSNDLTGVYSHPVVLNVANRVVYSAHDYEWDHGRLSSYDQLHTALGNAWGFIVAQGKTYTAPVWVSEFGTSHYGGSMGSGTWWSYLLRYLQETDFDWAVWRYDGTESNGTGRTFGAEETYGVLDTAWAAPAQGGKLLHPLQALQSATQGPDTGVINSAK